MQTFLGLFICCVLITAGTALECEVCKSLGPSCTGSLQTCGAGNDTCVTILSVNTQRGSSFQSIAKKCGSSSACQYGPKYMNFGRRKGLRFSATCCAGEACKGVIPQWPAAITGRNGKLCPACYTTSSSSRCNEGEKMMCVGPEDHCLDLPRKISYGTVVISTIQKGCVSKSVCDGLRTGERNSPGIKIAVTESECKPAPTASP